MTASKFIILTEVGDQGDAAIIDIDSIAALRITRISDGYGGKKKVTSVVLKNQVVVQVTQPPENVLKLIELKKESHD